MLKKGFENVTSTASKLFSGTTEFIRAAPVTSAAIAGLAGSAAGVLGTTAISRSTKTKRKSSSKRKRKKGRSRDWRYASKQKHEVAYRRRRRKLGKKSYQKYYKKKRGRVHYARKTGQPYIILASGKAKFIKGKRRK